MYSVEYKWTNAETPQTTTSMVVDKASKQNPQFTVNSSLWNHSVKKMKQLEPQTTVSI